MPGERRDFTTEGTEEHGGGEGVGEDGGGAGVQGCWGAGVKRSEGRAVWCAMVMGRT